MVRTLNQDHFFPPLDLEGSTEWTSLSGAVSCNLGGFGGPEIRAKDGRNLLWQLVGHLKAPHPFLGRSALPATRHHPDKISEKDLEGFNLKRILK